MSLVINHNLMAANAARNLGNAFGGLETSTRRLSSGLRITQASDDAAGLAVRELMRADITSLQQGIRNANDAISLIQTADGALGVIDEKLIRMKELAMQASTGTYNSDQRLIIDSEYQAMASEITRIANSTDFNGISLLNGNLSGSHDGSGLVSSGQLKVHFGSGNDCSEDYYYIQINSATAASLGLSGGNRSMTEAEIVAEDNLQFQTTYANVAAFDVVYDISGYPELSNAADFDQSQSINVYADNAVGVDVAFLTGTDGELYMINDNGSDVITGYGRIADNSYYQVAGGSASISTQALAQGALSTVQNAIISKDKIRANLGALQNRFENTADVLSIQAENMQAAESRISDVDVATEMTQFVRNQIMTQAAVSMLSQANSLPRMALSLIG